MGSEVAFETLGVRWREVMTILPVVEGGGGGGVVCACSVSACVCGLVKYNIMQAYPINDLQVG